MGKDKERSVICDREDEIAAFIPKEYWSVEAECHAGSGKKTFTASFHADENGGKNIESKAEAERIEQLVKKNGLKVVEVKRSERTRKAPLPFTTSTMQQEASKVLNFSTQKSMMTAQNLYEDGYISYLRTDSTRISHEAQAAANEDISEVISEANIWQKEQVLRRTTRRFRMPMKPYVPRT